LHWTARLQSAHFPWTVKTVFMSENVSISINNRAHLGRFWVARIERKASFVQKLLENSFQGISSTLNWLALD